MMLPIPMSVLKKGLIALAIGSAVTFSLYATFKIGRDHGQQEVKLEFLAKEKALQNAVEKLQKDITKAEEFYKNVVRDLEGQIIDGKLKYEKSLLDINSKYTIRLQQSEIRSETYKRMSQAGTAESYALADHAAKLDRSLEEGRRLVREFRTTLGQRDAELTLVGIQLRKLHDLIGNTEIQNEQLDDTTPTIQFTGSGTQADQMEK